MAFDLVRLAMSRACEKFGGNGTFIFNSAGFGSELRRLAGLDGGMDGRLVEAVLCGRDDVEILSGDSHFRMIPKSPA